MTLAFLGDSTLDFGNLNASARSLGERRPFRNGRYDGGGNVKASDGFVLGEQLARRLGAGSRRSPARLRSAELINLSDRPLRRGLRDKDANAEVFNFAYAGATSGGRGSTTAGLDEFRIGLKRQAATLTKAARFVPPSKNLDLVISGGTNDVFDYLDRNEGKVRRAILTPGTRDERRLATGVARQVVTNIEDSLDSITGLYDEALVIGTTKLSALPRIREASKGFGRVPLLGGSLTARFKKFVDRISRTINEDLEEIYNSNDRNGVFVVNGIDTWNDLSKKPGFVDNIHPNSRTNGRLADLVASQIRKTSALDSFGF